MAFVDTGSRGWGFFGVRPVLEEVVLLRARGLWAARVVVAVGGGSDGTGVALAEPGACAGGGGGGLSSPFHKSPT